MNEEYAEKVIAYVEAYYSQHKKDKHKPINWDLILVIKWLAHKCREIDRLKEILKENQEAISEFKEKLDRYRWINTDDHDWD